MDTTPDSARKRRQNVARRLKHKSQDLNSPEARLLQQKKNKYKKPPPQHQDLENPQAQDESVTRNLALSNIPTEPRSTTPRLSRPQQNNSLPSSLPISPAVSVLLYSSSSSPRSLSPSHSSPHSPSYPPSPQTPCGPRLHQKYNIQRFQKLSGKKSSQIDDLDTPTEAPSLSEPSFTSRLSKDIAKMSVSGKRRRRSSHTHSVFQHSGKIPSELPETVSESSFSESYSSTKRSPANGSPNTTTSYRERPRDKGKISQKPSNRNDNITPITKKGMLFFSRDGTHHYVNTHLPDSASLTLGTFPYEQHHHPTPLNDPLPSPSSGATISESPSCSSLSSFASEMGSSSATVSATAPAAKVIKVSTTSPLNKEKKQKKSKGRKSRTKENEETISERDLTLKAASSLSTSKTKNKSALLHDHLSPQFLIEPSNVSSMLRVGDLRDLIIYLLANGRAPTWIGIQQAFSISRVVSLYIPSLSPKIFGLNVDDYQPQEFSSGLDFFNDVFSHAWIVESPGNKFSIFPPTDSFLYLVPNNHDKKAIRNLSQNGLGKSHLNKNRCTPTDLIMSLEEMMFHKYPIHPDTLGASVASTSNSSLLELPGLDWVDTIPLSLDKKYTPKVFGIDCEMCKSHDSKELTRVTIVGAKGDVVLDELVKPDNEITDYLTQYSGITAKMLENITTRLADVQNKILDVISSQDIIIGHSLENDLIALKIRHPRVIDTALIYHNKTNSYNKPALRMLVKSHLKRDIQTGNDGHNSEEDAIACIDLLNLKLKHGPEYGHQNNDGKISLADRLSYVEPKTKTLKQVAVIDYGVPSWACKSAQTIVSCTDDDEIIKHSIKSASSHSFTWARLRELELLSETANLSRRYRRRTADKKTNQEKTEPVNEDSNRSESPSISASTVSLSPSSSSSSSVPSSTTLCESESASNNEESNDFEESVVDNRPSSIESQSSKNNSITSTDVSNDDDSQQQQKQKEESVNLHNIINESHKRLDERLKALYDSLPANTAVMIWTGHGDKQQMVELLAKRQQFTYEYHNKNWNDIKCIWTDKDAQNLYTATEVARKGVAFFAIKRGS